jgi:starvation-inducible DNA-binding protein
MAVEKPELVARLGETLGNTVVMYFKAHGHHWNVVGSDFAEFHDFFADIYEDVYSAIDPLAENMRKLGSPAPYRLADFDSLTSIQDVEIGGDAAAMCQDLLVANQIMIDCLNKAFTCANDCNEQGIANFLAERIDMHGKWKWQITAFMGQI